MARLVRRPLKSELLGPGDFRLRKLQSDPAEPRWLVEHDRRVCLPLWAARQPGPFPETKADSTGKLGSSDVTSTLAISSRSNHSCSARESEWAVAGSITVLRTVYSPLGRVVLMRGSLKPRPKSPTFQFSAGPLPRQLAVRAAWPERSAVNGRKGGAD
jgi:hypothetical protein